VTPKKVMFNKLCTPIILIVFFLRDYYSRKILGWNTPVHLGYIGTAVLSIDYLGYIGAAVLSND
jgi:hypothetical protein